MDRTNAVKMILTEMGVDSSNMSTQGFGSDRPIAPNDTAASPGGRSSGGAGELPGRHARLP
jgi:outer membrane protein OmpA-like peptidoglycan-associated protein